MRSASVPTPAASSSSWAQCRQTLRVFADPGEVAVTLGADLDPPEAVLRAAAAEGVDLRAITAELEREGVAAFCDSYRQLLGCIESKLGSLSAAAYGPGRPS